MVVADLEGDDLLLSQDKDFASGGLRQKSNIRPNRLFTADRHIVLYKAGHLKVEKLREVISKIVEIVQR
jgi:mRNA interferase MazF